MKIKKCKSQIFKHFLALAYNVYDLWYFLNGYILKTSPAIKVVISLLKVIILPLNIFSLTHYNQVLLVHTPENIRKPLGNLFRGYR